MGTKAVFRSILALAGVLVLAGLPAMAQEAQFDQAVAAEVMRGTVASQVAGAMQNNQQLLVDYQAVALEQGLAEEAAQRGLAERLEVQNRLQRARRQILIQALKEDLVAEAPAPTEEEMQKAYQAQPARWTLPPAFQLDAMEIDPLDDKTIQQARTLETGKAVSDEMLRSLKARALVTQASGNWVTAGQVAPVIWTNLPTMGTNEVRCFDTPAGRILVRRGAMRAPRQLSFEEVRPQVEGEARRAKEETFWNEYLAAKRKTLGF